MKARYYNGTNPKKLSEFPNFHKTGSISGMKKSTTAKTHFWLNTDHFFIM